MTYFNFDMTDTQEVVQIMLWIEGIESAFLRTTALAALTFYAVILGPIIEEVIFRGCVNPWIKGKLEENGYDIANNSLHKALYWTLCGTAFGAAHFSPTQGWLNIPVIVVTGLAGITLSMLKDEETSDITAPTATHMTNNGLMFAAYFLSKEG
jgi:membrane protease YdiL (CAAX protease family)